MKKVIFVMVLCFLFALVGCETDPAGNQGENYSVSFNLDDGEIVSLQGNCTEADEPGGSSTSEVVPKEVVNEPCVEKMGSTLIGWYLDSEFTIAYDFSNPVVSDLTLYAKWEKIDYTVNYYLNGEIYATETYNYDDTVLLISDLDLGESTFMGIYDNEDFSGERLSVYVSMPNNDLDLYISVFDPATELNVMFVPSRPADEILEVTSPLEMLLIDELLEYGFGIDSVNITVGSSYESVGESLLAGIADVAYLPAGTYVLYKDSIANNSMEVILAATRPGLNKDFDNAADWNDGLPTTEGHEQVPYYRGLIIAGTSAAARTLSDKVNAGNMLVWDDVKDLNWCVRNTTSSSGYLYPKLWLMDTFGKTFDDIDGSVIQSGGYGDTIAQLAAGTCDVGTIYGDARMHHADAWTNEYSRPNSIWEETDVIGVTVPIMNDVIVVNRDNLSDPFIDALIEIYLEMNQTQTGEDIMDIYSHRGYVEVDDEDYDSTRAINEMMD